MKTIFLLCFCLHLSIVTSSYDLKYRHHQFEPERYTFKVNPFFINSPNFERGLDYGYPKTFGSHSISQADSVVVNQPSNIFDFFQNFLTLAPSIKPRTRIVMKTLTSTLVTPRLAVCIPSILFSNPVNPTSCITGAIKPKSNDVIEDIIPSLVYR